MKYSNQKRLSLTDLHRRVTMRVWFRLVCPFISSGLLQPTPPMYPLIAVTMWGLVGMSSGHELDEPSRESPSSWSMVGPKQITSPAMSTQVIQVMLSRLTYRLHGYKELLPMTQQSFHHYQQELNTNEAMFASVNKLKMSYILRRNEYPSQSDWRNSSWCR